MFRTVCVLCFITFSQLYSAENNSCFSGFVFLDKNKDGKLDSIDFGITGVTVVIKGTNLNYSAITDSNGYYEFKIPANEEKNVSNAILLLANDTLPTGAEVLDKDIRITGCGKHNVAVYYETKFYNLYETTKRRNLKFAFKSEIPKALIYGNLKQKDLFINQEKIQFPQMKITIQKETLLAGEPLNITLEYGGQLTVEKIKKIGLAIKDLNQKIVLNSPLTGVLTAYSIPLKIAAGNYYFQLAFLLNDNSLVYTELKPVSIAANLTKPYEGLSGLKIDGETVAVDGTGRIYYTLEGLENLELDVTLSDGSRIKKNIVVSKKENPALYFVEEKVIEIGKERLQGVIQANYTGVLQKGIRFFLDGLEIIPDEKGNFSRTLNIKEGYNVFVYEFETNDKKRELYTKIISVTPENNAFSLAVILPKVLEEKFKPPKKEFLRIETTPGARITLNGKKLINASGKISVLHDFKPGRNKLEFTLSKNGKIDKKKLMIEIQDLTRNEKLFMSMGPAYTKVTSTTTGKASLYRDYTMKAYSLFIEAGGKPFSYFKATKDSKYFKDIITSLYFERGATVFTGTNESGETKKIIARPTTIDLKIYKYFFLAELFGKKFEKPLFANFKFAPLLTLENYSLNIERGQVLLNQSYYVSKLGALARYQFPWKLAFELGFSYGLFLSYAETPKIAELGVTKKSLIDYSCKLSYALTKKIDIALNYFGSRLSTAYKNGDAAKDMKSAFYLSGKYYFK